MKRESERAPYVSPVQATTLCLCNLKQLQDRAAVGHDVGVREDRERLHPIGYPGPHCRGNEVNIGSVESYATHSQQACVTQAGRYNEHSRLNLVALWTNTAERANRVLERVNLSQPETSYEAANRSRAAGPPPGVAYFVSSTAVEVTICHVGLRVDCEDNE